MKIVIAAFSDNGTAQQAASSLRDSGIQDQDVHILHDATAGKELENYQIPSERAHLYREVMRRGAPVVVAEVPDDRAGSVAADLDRLGSLDLDAAGERWRETGWAGYEEAAPAYDDDATASEKEHLERESLDVIEEEITVGKRAVARVGVRIHTFVVERPVHETVQLREEKIEVTREPVDESISPTDTTFQEDEHVITASGEEAVVGKEARVVERVNIDKTADVRTETIDETERRREVEVEKIDPDHPPQRR